MKQFSHWAILRATMPTVCVWAIAIQCYSTTPYFNRMKGCITQICSFLMVHVIWCRTWKAKRGTLDWSYVGDAAGEHAAWRGGSFCIPIVDTRVLCLWSLFPTLKDQVCWITYTMFEFSNYFPHVSMSWIKKNPSFVLIMALRQFDIVWATRPRWL